MRASYTSIVLISCLCVCLCVYTEQNADILSYTTDDFEVLEVGTVRKMLDLHFARTGAKMSAEAAMRPDEGLPKYSIQRCGLARCVVNNVFSFLCFCFVFVLYGVVELSMTLC
jgi:hypothetical protein